MNLLHVVAAFAELHWTIRQMSGAEFSFVGRASCVPVLNNGMQGDVVSCGQYPLKILLGGGRIRPRGKKSILVGHQRSSRNNLIAMYVDRRSLSNREPVSYSDAVGGGLPEVM